MNGSYFLMIDSKISFINNTRIFLNTFFLSNSTLSSFVNENILIIYIFGNFEFFNSNIFCDYISISSYNSFVLRGQIISTKKNCTQEELSPKNSKFFNFINYDKDFNIDIVKSYYIWSQNQTNVSKVLTEDDMSLFLTDLFKTNYTILIISQKSLNFESKFLLKGASIGIFADNMDIAPNVSITTQSMGCGPFEGSGHGTKIFNAQYECGGNGGGYGGFQGYGLGRDNVQSQLCKQFATDFSIQYGNQAYPRYHGSGGGGENASYGGGVIYINIINQLSNNGIVLSEGEDLMESYCADPHGPGAGSGGSIQVYAKNLVGNGIFSVKGGDSYNYCGEGGGGRILVFFYNWENQNAYYNSSAWQGKILTQKGNRAITMNFSNISWDNFYATNGCTYNLYKIYINFNYFYVFI